MAQSREISPYKCEDLGSITRTHVKRNPDIQIYNPRVWEVEIGRFWGLLASQPSLLVSSKVRELLYLVPKQKPKGLGDGLVCMLFRVP